MTILALLAINNFTAQIRPPIAIRMLAFQLGNYIRQRQLFCAAAKTQAAVVAVAGGIALEGWNAEFTFADVPNLIWPVDFRDIIIQVGKEAAGAAASPDPMSRPQPVQWAANRVKVSQRNKNSSGLKIGTKKE
jgi:hypothetical protein